MTCHSTLAITICPLTKKQAQIAHKMRRRELITRKRVQDECHRWWLVGSFDRGALILGNSYGSCFSCLPSCFNNNRTFLDFRAVVRAEGRHFSTVLTNRTQPFYLVGSDSLASAALSA